MSFNESELLPLSGVQHVVFCERQAALIHVEQVWEDNLFTVDGRHRHRAVHEEAPRRERRGDLLIVRGLSLRSFELGLTGVADVVEFHRVQERTSADGRSVAVPLPGVRGVWRPFPVEYKRGRPKAHRADEVQLCAQALCLEEMLRVFVPEGALFYGATKRRMEVVFDQDLRQLTKEAARRFRELVDSGITPSAHREKKCSTCSLVELCMPEAMTKRRSARRYLLASVERSLREL